MQVIWGNPPPGLYNIPVHLGLEQGYFDGAGVRVMPRDHRNGMEYAEAVAAGAIDVGHMGTPPFLPALAQNPEIAIIGQGLVAFGIFHLVVSPEVRSAADLVGRRVAVNRMGTCPQVLTRTHLDAREIGTAGIQFVEVHEASAQVQAAREGRVSAAMLWEPYVSQLVDELGWRVEVATDDIPAPPYYSFVVFAHRRLLRDQPEAVAHCLNGYYQGVHSVQDHLDEAAHFGTSYLGFSRAVVQVALEREAPRWTARPMLDLKRLEQAVEELKRQGRLPAGFDVFQTIVPGALPPVPAHGASPGT